MRLILLASVLLFLAFPSTKSTWVINYVIGDAQQPESYVDCEIVLHPDRPPSITRNGKEEQLEPCSLRSISNEVRPRYLR